ncbi:hypothetical protein SELMODRAFT_106857 [Selaginella moellendorffii]|uniref:Pentacotripeptide-repeat region of PRORP domain-containing protein n=1 Tax=Selaginella moellendorffii TaxID=88036 RepID=D8S2J0_SELML|nr:hypothetical protein SELMODRAFT_106857 [Selaginella moellendorffii]
MPQHSTVAYRALLSFFAKANRMHEAQYLFHNMPEWDLVSWNTLLLAYAQDGQGLRAVRLLNELSLVEMPDEISFVSILLVCNHLGNVMDACSNFCSVTNDYGLKRIIRHYSCMVDVFGRAGYLDLAEYLIDVMPFVPEPWIKV